MIGGGLRSLRGKIVLPLFLGGAVVAAAGSWLTYRTTIAQVEQQLLQRSHLLASALNHSAMVATSHLQVQHVVDEIISDSPEVRRIVIATSAPWKILASSVSDWTGQPLDRLPDGQLRGRLLEAIEHGSFGHHFGADDQAFFLVAPLEGHNSEDIGHSGHLGPGDEAATGDGPGQKMAQGMGMAGREATTVLGPEHRTPPVNYRGVILLELNQSGIEEASASILGRLLAALLAGVLLTMCLAYLLVSRHVLAPLGRIRTAMNSRKSGDEFARAPALGDDEIGVLAETFNQTLDALDGQGAALRDTSDKLAETVQEAEQANILLQSSNERLRQEISDHERTEEALRQSEAAAARAEGQLRDAIDSISEGFALFDADDRLTLCNNRFRDIHADGADSIGPGARYDEILRSAVNRGRIHAAVEEAEDPLGELGSGRDSRAKPVELELDNGRWLRLSEYKTKEGGRVGIFTDISVLKHREAALGESEKRFRLLAEAAPDGIMIDDGGRIIDANRNLARLLRCDYAELEGKNVFDFLTDESKRILAEEDDSGDENAYEVVAVRADGSTFPAEIKSNAIRSGGRQIRVSTLRDITERKYSEERLRQSQKLEAIGQLAGGVAHDYNNLLTVIDGFTKRALARTDDTERVKGSLAEVVKATEKAAGLTRQLLTFSRSRVLKKEVVRVADMFADVESLLRPLLGERIELRLEMAAERACVETDSGQLFQAVVNLAINARDAMPMGGPLTIGTHVLDLDQDFVSQSPNAEPGRYVEIFVKDEGLGMDAETLGHIYEPFFTTKEPGAGTGLGLAMVYGFVQEVGGILDISSTPDAGSEFKLYFPCADAEPKRSVNMSGVSCRANGETVLVVEDDDSLRLLAQETLEELGYHVLTARDGVDALEVDDDHDGPIDLLLSDVVMPGLGGPEAARAIRVVRPEIKVIFMSGYPGRGTSETEPLPEDAPFLPKPFDPYSLATLVREVLDGSATTRRRAEA